MTTALDTAVAAQVMWKPGPVLSACVAMVKAGLSELDKGRGHFGPDNVPEGYVYDGQGIAGTAARMLRQAGVIRNSQHHRPDEGVYHGRRRSLRSTANGRKIDLYELTSRGLAEAFVKRHDKEFKLTQQDWVELADNGKLVEGRVTA